MTSREERRRRGAPSKSASIEWKERHDALLTVLNAVLLAKGDGPDRRLAIGDAYYAGQPRRNVVVEHFPGRIIVYLEAHELPVEDPPSRWARLIAWLRARLP